eukprot:6602465-Karenia_brevis.AAC.1
MPWQDAGSRNAWTSNADGQSSRSSSDNWSWYQPGCGNRDGTSEPDDQQWIWEPSSSWQSEKAK